MFAGEADARAPTGAERVEQMPDDSHLDRRYFLDEYVYNCPFCNRRNVAYYFVRKMNFDWTVDRTVTAYSVACGSCHKVSMHLSDHDFSFYEAKESGYRSRGSLPYYHPNYPDEVKTDGVDSLFFHSVPSSFFTLDDRIPRTLRDLFAEAEGCLRANFLTGASACARKVIYEMAAKEGAKGDDYETRLKSLKAKHLEVDGSFFDTLITIQQTTSSKVHENALDGWKAADLKLMLATLAEVLEAIYVLPKEMERKRNAILKMRDKLLPKPPEKKGD
jgi:hypothetical protein